LFLRRTSYANVTATLALVIALGGTSYAAVAVTGADVKNGSLTGRDVKNNSLRGRDVQGIHGWDIEDGAVKGIDIADHSIMSRDLHGSVLDGALKGAKGDAGAKGETGAAGTTNVVVRTNNVSTALTTCRDLAASEGGPYLCSGTVDKTAGCDPGERATGGGYENGQASSFVVEDDRPVPTNGTPDGWNVKGLAQGSVQPTSTPPDINVPVYVICASP
jgi:hypothetical protein